MKAAVAAVVAMAAVVMLVSGTAAQGPAPAAVPGGQAAKIGYIDVQRGLARSGAGGGAREQPGKERAADQKGMGGRPGGRGKAAEQNRKRGARQTGHGG